MFFFLVAALLPTIAHATDILDMMPSGLACGANSTTNCDENPENGLFAGIACKVMKVFNSGVVPLYCNMIFSSYFQSALGAALTLYTVFVGFAYVTHMVPMKTSHAITKVIKAAAVYGILMNSDLFFSMVYSTIIETTDALVRAMVSAQSGGGAQSFFEYVDQAMYKVFDGVFYSEANNESGATTQQPDFRMFLLGMAMMHLTGDLFGGIFFAVTIGWILSYFSIMVRYLLAFMSMVFVIMLGPIFIPTILFEKTKYMFEEWIKMLVCFMVQVVLVVAYLLMVEGFFTDFYNQIKSVIENQNTKIEEVDNKRIVNFGDGVGVDRVVNDYGANMKSAEKYINDSGMSSDKIPEFVFNMMLMMVMVVLSMMFMKQVPSLAVLVTGQFRFIQFFQGSNFSGKNTELADLFGQKHKATKENPLDNFLSDMIR